MTPSECERIFERIEEYKRSTEKYIQDVADLIVKINEGYVVQENTPEDEDEMEIEVDQVDNDVEYQHEYEPVENEEEIFAFDENEDLADFLIETFDL